MDDQEAATVIDELEAARERIAALQGDLKAEAKRRDERVIALYRDDRVGLAEAARLSGMSGQGVRKMLHRNGVPIRDQGLHLPRRSDEGGR